MSLRQMTIGSLAMSSVSVFRILLQISILPVLARFLSPSDYGIVAMAMPFIIFAMVFSDAGISSSLIKNKTSDDTEWSTSFWLTVVLGFILIFVIGIIGYVASVFLSEPLLFPVICALSLTVLFQSISAVPGARLQQNHKFLTVAIIEIVAMIISLICALIVAIHGGGIWALVIQQISQFFPRLTLTFLSSSFRPRMIFKLDSIKEHLVFGRDMLGINFINFIRQSLTNISMGRFLGSAPVGIFTMASTFSDLPGRIISGPIQNVLYPRAAGLKDNLPTIKRLFLFISKIISILTIPTIGMLAVAHAPVFTILLSEKWAHAGLVFMVLAPGATVQTITAFRYTISMAFGKTDTLLKQNTEILMISIITLCCTMPFGLEWVAMGLSIVNILYFHRSLKNILPLIQLDVRTYIEESIFAPLMITVAAIFIYLTINITITLSNWEQFGIAAFIGILSLGTLLILESKSLKSDILYLKEHIV